MNYDYHDKFVYMYYIIYMTTRINDIRHLAALI